jgi:nicotinate phosphoribosyltransferase
MSYALNADRYHAVMGNFLLTEHAILPKTEKLLGDIDARFYITQRKLPYAPCLGHDNLTEMLFASRADAARANFLRNDRANLKFLAGVIEKARFQGEIRTVPEATIVFAGEPFADVIGSFTQTQLFEVYFEHAFDFPMTVASRALQMKLAAGDSWLSDFSLRRSGSLERAVEASKYAYIGGCDDTSNLEAGFQFNIPTIGTMAHYLTQAFILAEGSEADQETGQLKHFERIAFERWLDAHPKGTVCLIDTISVYTGTIHVIQAAKSSPARRQALKGVRIDSGDLIKLGWWVRKMLDVNGLRDVGLVLTGDLDTKKIREIKTSGLPVMGFGVGTKLTAEIDQIAGVIFKLCAIGKTPSLKCSETPGKETLPGTLQIWRYEDADGRYIQDRIGFASNPEHPTPIEGLFPKSLLRPFWKAGWHPELKTVAELKEFVQDQIPRFQPSIEQYPVIIEDDLQKEKKVLVERMKREGGEIQGITILSTHFSR